MTGRVEERRYQRITQRSLTPYWDEVEATNNRAEQGARPVVPLRKVGLPTDGRGGNGARGAGECAGDVP